MTKILVCPDTGMISWLYDFFKHHTKLLENIKQFARVDWINNGSFIWNDEFDVPLAQMMTRRGMGFTFNTLRDDEFFNLKK